jgi:hypothetical protein
MSVKKPGTTTSQTFDNAKDLENYIWDSNIKIEKKTSVGNLSLKDEKLLDNKNSFRPVQNIDNQFASSNVNQTPDHLRRTNQPPPMNTTEVVFEPTRTSPPDLSTNTFAPNSRQKQRRLPPLPTFTKKHNRTLSAMANLVGGSKVTQETTSPYVEPYSLTKNIITIKPTAPPIIGINNKYTPELSLGMSRIYNRLFKHYPTVDDLASDHLWLMRKVSDKIKSKIPSLQKHFLDGEEQILEMKEKEKEVLFFFYFFMFFFLLFFFFFFFFFILFYFQIYFTISEFKQIRIF